MPRAAFVASARRLQDVAHLDSVAVGPGFDRERCRLERWRAHAHLGIARKAKTLCRDQHRAVNFAVVVLIMHQRDGISAGRDALEGDRQRFLRRDSDLMMRGLLLAIREILLGWRQARMHHAFHIAHIVHGHTNISGLARRAAQHCGPADQA